MPPNPNPNPKVVKAFKAMRELGISEEKVKPVLKRLLKLYDKNWDLIEEENYRALADAIFDSEETEAAESKKEPENNEQERVVEDALGLDELGQPLKRLRLRYQGQASERCNGSTLLVGTSLIIPKDEPVELPEVQLENQVQSTVSRKPPSNGSTRVGSSHLSSQPLDRNKGQQPVSPKPLTFRERTDTFQPINGNKSQVNIPLTTESSAGPNPPTLRNRGKEPLSPHSASVEKMLESERSSQAVSQEKTVGHQSLVQPREAPLVGDAAEYDLQETSNEGDSSRKSCLDGVQNGSAPKEPPGRRDASNGAPAKIPDESSSQLEIASSCLGEVKLCLSYKMLPRRPDLQVPTIDAVVKLVEEKYLKSYKNLDPNFSLMKLMQDMCEGVVELGFEPCNTSAETNGR